MNRILVAEDEKSIRDFIVIHLKHQNYEVLEAENGEQAIALFDEYRDDILIAVLDIMMPQADGIEVCRYLRNNSSTIGIILLTAKTQESDKVTGFSAGADDYVTKPFSPSELTARVEAIARRVQINRDYSNRIKKESDIITLGKYVLNIKSRTLTKNNIPIELTQVEFLIIEYFFRNPNVTLSRNEILSFAWGDSYFGDDKVVDVNIRRLRVKVEDSPSQPEHLTTIWGVGYKWIP